MLPNPAAYVHFPWCVVKCPYCDFNSHPLREADDFAAYTKHLLSDWATQRLALGRGAKDGDSFSAFASVFLGGGTPSLFAPCYIKEVLKALPLQTNAEVTMEANPGTTEHADFSGYRAAGVNRLSIGAQSFDDAQLKKLGRIHAAGDTERAFNNARAGGFDNINIDLMWGLPEQSVSDALTDLQVAIDLGAEHISWYQLTIEAKTEFAKRPPILPVDETLANIEKQGLELLATAGYQRYEVSAFAKANYQCRHNLNYWSFGDYIGIGAGAHGKISQITRNSAEIVRSSKASQPRLYQADPEQTQRLPVARTEHIVEFMMNALRLVDGVERSLLEERTGRAWADIAVTWQALLSKGLVRADRCATTPMGLRYLDSVISEFLND